MHKHGGDIYRNQGVVDYSANINFRGMPESVRQAAKDAIDASVCYPDPQCEELKAAIEAEGGKVAGSVRRPLQKKKMFLQNGFSAETGQRM